MPWRAEPRIAGPNSALPPRTIPGYDGLVANRSVTHGWPSLRCRAKPNHPALRRALPNRSRPDLALPGLAASPAITPGWPTLPCHALPHRARPHAATPDEALRCQALPGRVGCYSTLNDSMLKRPMPMLRPLPRPTSFPASIRTASISARDTMVLSHSRWKVAIQPVLAAMR